MSDEEDASPAILVTELAGSDSTRSAAAPAISSDSCPLLVPRVGLGPGEFDDGLAILVAFIDSVLELLGDTGRSCDSVVWLVRCLLGLCTG